MKYNQYSYLSVDQKDILKELKEIGFDLPTHLPEKELFEWFVRKVYFTYKDTDYPLSNLVVDSKTDFLTYIQSDCEWSPNIFYTVALQLLGFRYFIDFEDTDSFLKEVQFPIEYGNLVENLYHLLNTRTVKGNLLIDQLVSDGLIPEDNQYHYFNGKSLATFTSHDAIREVVYVESRVDTDKDGLPDLVKVSIIRPRYEGKIPAVMTASPYHQGTNDKASDKALYNMNVDLEVKEPHTIQVEVPQLELVDPVGSAELVDEAEETLTHINSSYTLNDYLLPRGYANLYVSGVGTKDSQGLMTNGNYQQIEAYKNVIDWLNGRCRAFTDHTRKRQVKADWSNGKVATTGISYLGTMSNGLATTGVDGLEVIIAEAGISSWYNYYRENGLVTSPGGYPGEDFDSLAELTYSRNLLGGDYLHHNAAHQADLDRVKKELDRASGDYNQFWHDRNYLLHADRVQAEVVFTHGSQDWNVKPLHVFNMFQALPASIKKHLFYHNGAHVYLNNWQSIDFRESMNALLSKKLLGYDSSYELPTVIWQDNTGEQSWTSLDDFGNQTSQRTFSLGDGEKVIQNRYETKDYERYGKAYPTFLSDLYQDKAQQVTIDLPIEEDLHLNGKARLHLRLHSSTNKGLLSAQLLELGSKKYLQPYPAVLSVRTLDNGRYHMLDNLTELPFKEAGQRVISKGYLNLQNRHDLLEVEDVTPGEWMEFDFDLQPTIYKLEKGATLRLVLYTTDFEITVRDQTDYQLTIDLAQSSLHLPEMTEVH
ncbi:Xaa-Pro dipeptidyl-peptidase [Streptococcus parasanguinis]|jgi:X-Pro dipeptidyl-peptidase|uniref:Xaa-Pro dipeptidyl-peptidase n=2 Tax=Streptococcus parasanguinis TaxID=1318 RepID=A0A4Q5BNT3_STRPA|nr:MULTISPECIES: Xaa-Pro dipeptidyl-peptidase [Streptococcus]MBK5126090.1 Xaa-Pro dipeptidyl-peptidase [Streptococcus parasanguinis]MDG3028728.1 Xaa-Pro dipeptidyl-peptidase [Streptococcus sp. ST2]MDO6230860.1 Xaa-Pro dipeptidyl-peptidase [Streptococcus parasanguinis]MDU4778953.1 Xaa-Pro dipeptidyl-peptidase [Streptococcus parasanguinis]MTR53115.1 Xaa-Pro dipeptidyl-peptidase [Streptococcus parasanguinis]